MSVISEEIIIERYRVEHLKNNLSGMLKNEFRFSDNSITIVTHAHSVEIVLK